MAVAVIPTQATVLAVGIAAPASVTMTDGVTTAIPGVSLSETGNLPGETFTATFTDTTGMVTATGTGYPGPVRRL